jgi:transglutaminase-like putative cysteine protease
MIYKVRHRTTYRYEKTSTYARCVFRLRPQDSERQSVFHHTLSTEPEARSVHPRPGPFGEATVTVVIEEPHATLVVEANSVVDVHSVPVDLSRASLPWEAIRGQSLEVASLEPDSPAVFLYPSLRVPVADVITDYGRASFAPGCPVIEAVTDLMRRMHDDFSFDSEATIVSTPATEAFEARRGVCQDFAHIMISALRGLGLPAAYASGYVRTRPVDGRRDLTGSDASHAWVNVWCGADRGWIGFDPTNAVYAQDDHIVLAVGRDYSDVAPIDGILLSPGDQAIEVEVDVIPSPELGSLRPSSARAMPISAAS